MLKTQEHQDFIVESELTTLEGLQVTMLSLLPWPQTLVN